MTDLSNSTLSKSQQGLHERCQTAIGIDLVQPGGDRIGIMLGCRAAFTRQAATPHGRIDFDAHRAAGCVGVDPPGTF
jgi:hypothetical protein